MKIIRWYGLAGLVFLFSGCAHPPYSEAPRPVNFKYSEQHKLQSASHWKLISEHFVSSLDTELKQRLGCAAACPDIYINPKGDVHHNPSPFSKMFSKYIREAFLKKGWRVLESNAPDAVMIDVETDLSRFEKEHYDGNDFQFLTPVAPYIWFLAETGIHPAIKVMGTAGAIDYYRWKGTKNASGKVPKYELQVHVSGKRNGRYLAQKSAVYYIADVDAENYIKPEKTYRIRVYSSTHAESH